jgi:hypothetical protein
MTDTLKVLGQVAPSATTWTDLYEAPKTAVVHGIVCNRGTADATFRMTIAVLGAALDNKQYIYYDEPIKGNKTFTFSLGIMLGASDKIRVYASNGNLTFTLYGIEVEV